jgi:glycosyltransferase involved in cell wall biosynthesis
MTQKICLPITVIVPTFNDGDYLSEALNSILLQSSPPEMLIVVDDGSCTADAEKSVNEFRKLGQIPTKIVYLKQANKGPSAARNEGLRLVTTPYVTFLDADDRMLPDNLASMWQALNALADDYFGVYGTHCDRATGKPYAYGNLDGCIAADRVGRKGGVAGGVHTYLFRTHYLAAIQGFDPEFIE